MKPSRLTQILAITTFALCSLQFAARSQTTFNSGSNGSYGPLTVSGTETLQIPSDGIFHCTTVNVDYPSQLYFIRNAANTPVYILATGDVNLSGLISVQGGDCVGRRGGSGGPGGFAGGQGGTNPSNGFGPGAGKGGWVAAAGIPNGKIVRGGGGFGSAGLPVESGGPVYSNSLLIPLMGGSGGGGSDAGSTGQQLGGGGGGGALLIASSTKIHFGPQGGFAAFGIQAYGGSTGVGTGGGSGGSVRLVAPSVSGNPSINVNGVEGAGRGRIRVDSLTNNLNLTSADATFGANMVVFPTNLPEIRVTKAAGTDIALTQTDPVFVLLPAGAPATQTVQVQVKNFNSVVPLSAVVTPEAGDRTKVDFTVDNTSGGTATGSVQVQIPAGVSTRIDVWTR